MNKYLHASRSVRKVLGHARESQEAMKKACAMSGVIEWKECTGKFHSSAIKGVDIVY